MKMTTLIVPALISILGAYRTAVAQPSEKVLDAIQRVESGGSKDPANQIGDNKKALGWMQLHRPYVQDAKEYDKSLGKYTYEEICRSRELSRKATVAYLTRYAGKDATPKQYSFCHNSGSGWRKKTGRALENLNKYWAKIQKHLK